EKVALAPLGRLLGPVGVPNRGGAPSYTTASTPSGPPLDPSGRPATASPFGSSAIGEAYVSRVGAEMTCGAPSAVAPAGAAAGAWTRLGWAGDSNGYQAAITSPAALPNSTKLFGMTGTGVIDCTPRSPGNDPPGGRREKRAVWPALHPTMAPPWLSTTASGPW